MGVHHVVHRTTFGNLKSPKDLTFIARIEVFMMNMYGYFNHSPKRHLKFYKLTQIWKVKGSKILKNVKTRWMSMLEPLKNIMVKYLFFLLVVMKLIVIQPMCQRWTCYAFVSFSFLFELCILCVMWFLFIFVISVACKLALSHGLIFIIFIYFGK